MAVEKGHMDTVRCLVEKGANISIQDKAGLNNATLPIGRHLSLLIFILRNLKNGHVFVCVIKSIHLVYVQNILYFLKYWAEQMEKCPELHLCYKRLKGLNKKR